MTDRPLGQILRKDGLIELRYERRLAQPPEVAWRALTESDQLRHWLPCDIVGERRAGASIVLPFWPIHVERYGIPADQVALAGKIRAWDPPRTLEWTWDVDVLRWELTPHDGGTRLVFSTVLGTSDTHDYPPTQTAAGYHVCLDQLTELLATGAVRTPLVDVFVADLEAAYGGIGEVALPDPHGTKLGPPRIGPGLVIAIDGAHRGADLAAWLLSPHRRRPAVVASVPADSSEPRINVHELAEQRADSIEVYRIDSAAARTLTALLPHGSTVHSGAVRVYPASPLWHGSPDAAPLLLARNRAETDTLGSRLRAAIRTTLRSANAEAASVAPRPSNVVPPMDLPAHGSPHQIATVDEAVALAGHLLDARRQWPVVIVTTHPDATEPFLPAAEIARDLRGVAAVAQLTPGATSGLTEGLDGRHFSASYGAGRVYPVGRGWLRDTNQAPLRICLGPTNAAAVSSRLIGDALIAAAAAGILRPPVAAEGTASALVLGTLGQHNILVSVEGGRQSVLLAARLRLGVPAERLVSVGQQLRGWGTADEFQPVLAPDDPRARVRAAYPQGSVALAQVAQVGAASAMLLLHPDVPAALLADDSGPDVRDLLAVDDVVAVTVRWSGGEPRVALAGAEPDPGVSVLSEGPAWLSPQDLEPDSRDPLPVEVADLPAGPPANQQEGSARDAAAQYADELARVYTEHARLLRRQARLRATLRKAVQSG